MQISVDEFYTLLSKLGIDLKNVEIQNTLINEFLPHVQIDRKELINSVLIEANFNSTCEGYNELVRAIELKMQNPRCQRVYGTIAQEKFLKEDFTKEEYFVIERLIRNVFKRHFHEYNTNYNPYPEFVHKMYSTQENRKNMKLIDFLAIYISSLEKKQNEINQKVLVKKRG